ncbi:MAG TPA: hypothetical protein VHX14_16070 [Thermoanaerobaculia bacterium]|jgi:hypothetical protein|nr:hypothetical protein [Thermoanaerobaculia bacterium]
MAEHPNFWDDIFPLFTDIDISCMRARDVLLASIDWWKSGSNFNTAFNMLKSGRMPLGGPVWDPGSVQMLADWKANNFEEGPKPDENE